MNKWAFMLLIFILWIPALCDAHITADFDKPGAYHEDRQLNGQTWHVHVVPDVDVSWWTYDGGLVAGEWGQDEVVDPLPTPTPDTSTDPLPENRVVPEQDPIVRDNPPNAPEDPVVPPANDGRASTAESLESTPNPTNVPTQQSVEPPQPQPTQYVQGSGDAPSRSVGGNLAPEVKLMITHIHVRQRPYTLFVYVQNASERFIGNVVLEIRNSDDTLTRRHRFRNYFTPGWVNPRKHKDYVSEDGITANNLIAIAGNHVMKSWNHRKETARFRIGVRQFRSRNIYTEDSKIRLLLGDRVIGEHPQPAVMGSPKLSKGKLATSWAEMKGR